MSGSDAATVAAPAKTAPKTAAASHAWRRKTASARVIAEPPPVRARRAALTSLNSRWAVAISGHDERVAGSEEENLHRAAGNDLVVVAGNPGHRRTLHADDRHLRSTSEIVEPSGERDGVEDRGPALQVVATGLLHLPDHRDLQAVDLTDDDRHLRRGDVLRQPPGQIGLELLGREAGGLHVVEQRQRDHAVGPHWHRAAEPRVVPDGDIEDVLGTHRVPARRNWWRRERMSRPERQHRHYDRRTRPSRPHHRLLRDRLSATSSSVRLSCLTATIGAEPGQAQFRESPIRPREFPQETRGGVRNSRTPRER